MWLSLPHCCLSLAVLPSVNLTSYAATRSILLSFVTTVAPAMSCDVIATSRALCFVLTQSAVRNAQRASGLNSCQAICADIVGPPLSMSS